ncbi:MAG: hypothetical protein K6T65_02080 [Peptococcaceae bacterium]|nr:hypothetical protein [Peptococcaceae bacterium]
MWEAVLMSNESEVAVGKDIKPDELHPMGSREEIISRLKKTFGAVIMLGSNRLAVRGGDFDIHFDIGESDPVSHIKLVTNGEIYVVLERLNKRYQWKVFDLQVNDFLDFSADRQSKDKGKAEKTDAPAHSQEEPVLAWTRMAIFAGYFLFLAFLLILDYVVRPFIVDTFLKGLFSTFISLITLYILYRYGRYNSFVGKAHALLMSMAVSLFLMGLNIAKNLEIALNIKEHNILEGLAFALTLKALIYFVFIFLGVKIRMSMTEGEQTLEFRWR